MSDKKKYTFSDIVDSILGLGGVLFGFFLTMIVFAGHHIPPPALFMVMAGWLVGGVGGYRLMNRRNKELQEELNEYKYPQHSAPALPPTTSSYMRERPAKTPEAVALEVRILDFMAMRKGRITVLEAVVYLREPIDHIKPVLEKLQREGFIRVDVSDSGELFYVTDAFQVS